MSDDGADRINKFRLSLRLTVLAIFVALTVVGWWSVRGLIRVPIDASISAEPNPVVVCDGSGLGQTRVGWFREGFGTVQVRVGSPRGELLVRSGAFGTTETGKWVRDGLKLFLLDDQDSRVLATVTLRVKTSPCE